MGLEAAHPYPCDTLHSAATTARGDVLMYRDFAADCSVGADEHSSTCRESASTVLKSFHVASATAEEEAELIMRRLVRNYLERSPIGSSASMGGF
jgi:hypothetical protein